MFTSDDLEAAGRRAATNPVERVPDVEDIHREVARRRQSKRLLAGASATTALLFAIGGGLLLRSGNDQVQVITASPVLESTVTPASSEVAGREADTDRTHDAEIVEVDDGDGVRGADGRDRADGNERADGDEGLSSSSADDEGESGKSTYAEPSDNDADGDDRSRNDEDWDHDGDLSLGPSEYLFPEDFEEWLKQLDGHDWSEDEFSNGFEFWPLPLGRFDVEVSLGDEAIRRAKQAAANADDEFIVEDRTLWISRQNRRDTVTVSSLIEDDWFVAAAGPADQEKTLIRLLSQYDGNWEDRITDEDLEWLRKRDWLSWPPTHDDWEEWNDAREDWLAEHEDALKEARELVEEQRKEIEEERKRIEEERKRIEEERKEENKDDEDDDD